MSMWTSETDPICWHQVTNKCNTRNKAKLLALGEGLEDSEYIDLRVRKVYGRSKKNTELTDHPDIEEWLELCDKNDDGAFPVWEVRDCVLQEWHIGAE